MQVDPAAATIVYVNTPDGNELTLDPGRQVVARVVSVDERGAAKISLAGQVIDVQAAAQLRVGQDVQLAVTRADASGVRLAIVAPPQSPSSAPSSAPSGLPQLIGELARAGVPVTAQVTQAVQSLMDELAGGGVTTGGGSSAARAIAALASRDIALSPAAAGRVAAALDLAGSMGPALADLAAKSSTVAAALPAGAPNAAAIRSLLAPGLSMTELAVARVVQAGQASPAGANVSALPAASTNSAVIQNYVASQVASTAHLDDLASLNSLMSSAGAGGRSQAQVPQPAVGGAITAAAQDAALRGQSTAGQIAPGPTPATIAAQAAQAQAQAATSLVDDAATAASTTTARSTATAAAATGAGSAIPTPTNAGVAQAVADLGALATRFAAVAGPAAGAAAGAAQQAGNATNSTVIAQQAGRDGSAGAAAASNAGASADGDPMPIVTAVQTFLASPRAEADAAKLLGSLQGSSAAAQQSALRMLPESQTLQLAGQLLDLLPDGAQLRGGQLQELRTGVHNALDSLGRALAQPGGDDVSALRA
ncbi:MAG: hypothetical protein JWM25_292, partial [Thermoleophilia bacterium]|nr:hypothetical protein [Thermoleophilia bacterium]